MMMCVYASEVAALAGMHPYRSREQVISSILKRRGVDTVASANALSNRMTTAAVEVQCEAHALQAVANAEAVAVKTTEKKAVEGQRRVDACEAVLCQAQAQLHAASPSELHEVQQTIHDATRHAEDAQQEARDVLDQVKRARTVAASATAMATAATKRAAVALADAAAAKRVAATTRHQEALESAVAGTLRNPLVAQSLQRAVTCSTSTNDAIVRFSVPTHTRDPNIARELENVVSCRMGEKMESVCLDKYTTKHVPTDVHLDVKQKGYTRGGFKTPTGLIFKLFGRLDGLRGDGTVVETGDDDLDIVKSSRECAANGRECARPEAAPRRQQGRRFVVVL